MSDIVEVTEYEIRCGVKGCGAIVEPGPDWPAFTVHGPPSDGPVILEGTCQKHEETRLSRMSGLPA